MTFQYPSKNTKNKPKTSIKTSKVN